jgi:rod shape determining protein RodA
MAPQWWRTLRARFDWPLTIATAVILTMGLLNLYSATLNRQGQLVGRQIWWLVMGAGVFLLAATFDYRRLIRWGYFLYAPGILVLIWVLVGGRSSWGAQRWLDIGPIAVQPSEMMKILLVLALAKHFQDAPSVKQRTLRHLLIPVCLAALPALLVAAQPDLSNALLLTLTFLTVLLIARLSLRTWIGIMIAALLALVPMWEYGLRQYQRNRIIAFVNPELDPATAWQPQQAMSAVGSGQTFGKGHLRATVVRARSLPALWTDFPFAVWGEEWGFFGGLLLLGCYAFLILWILKIGREARDRFGAILCVGCAGLLFWQIMFNVSMVTGLGPVAGVTLPLISYGGSSLMTLLGALGLVMNVSLRRFSYDAGPISGQSARMR